MLPRERKSGHGEGPSCPAGEQLVNLSVWFSCRRPLLSSIAGPRSGRARGTAPGRSVPVGAVWSGVVALRRSHALLCLRAPRSAHSCCSLWCSSSPCRTPILCTGTSLCGRLRTCPTPGKRTSSGPSTDTASRSAGGQGQVGRGQGQAGWVKVRRLRSRPGGGRAWEAGAR